MSMDEKCRHVVGRRPATRGAQRPAPIFAAIQTLFPSSLSTYYSKFDVDAKTDPHTLTKNRARFALMTCHFSTLQDQSLFIANAFCAALLIRKFKCNNQF